MLVRQTFSAFVVNAVVIITVSAVLLGIQSSSDMPAGTTHRPYILGFVAILVCISAGIHRMDLQEAPKEGPACHGDRVSSYRHIHFCDAVCACGHVGCGHIPSGRSRSRAIWDRASRLLANCGLDCNLLAAGQWPPLDLTTFSVFFIQCITS
ncbi:hypothetical protein GOP47_0007859 [Adiantum capillus-veneris]|uniref:Uncharacterized protein n=1 Tax=Adiantum capillus-veneris TaxID=13818 RepID=A0A9D4V239_ADICA|nr:hypothetical protein GOP47_0007859 [Adiantum capillus-veneris]